MNRDVFLALVDGQNVLKMKTRIDVKELISLGKYIGISTSKADIVKLVQKYQDCLYVRANTNSHNYGIPGTKIAPSKSRMKSLLERISNDLTTINCLFEGGNYIKIEDIGIIPSYHLTILSELKAKRVLIEKLKEAIEILEFYEPYAINKSKFDELSEDEKNEACKRVVVEEVDGSLIFSKVKNKNKPFIYDKIIMDHLLDYPIGYNHIEW